MEQCQQDVERYEEGDGDSGACDRVLQELDQDQPIESDATDHRDSDGDGTVDSHDPAPRGEDGYSDPGYSWDAAEGESPPPLDQSC